MSDFTMRYRVFVRNIDLCTCPYYSIWARKIKTARWIARRSFTKIRDKMLCARGSAATAARTHRGCLNTQEACDDNRNGAGKNGNGDADRDIHNRLVRRLEFL